MHDPLNTLNSRMGPGFSCFCWWQILWNLQTNNLSAPAFITFWRLNAVCLWHSAWSPSLPTEAIISFLKGHKYVVSFFIKGSIIFQTQLRAVVLAKVAQSSWVIVWKQTKGTGAVNVFGGAPRRWSTCGFRWLDRTQTRRLWCSEFNKKLSFIPSSADAGCAAHYLAKIRYLCMHCTLLFQCLCIHLSYENAFQYFTASVHDFTLVWYVTYMSYVLFKSMRQHMSTLV